VISAINHLHAHGVVHRDIKAENIMFKSAENKEDIDIKIIDFGLSAKFHTENNFKSLKTIVGSPYYLAPEILTKNYNEQCDMWSVGVLTYFMLSGTFPFDGKSHAELISKTLK
jgi:calcium-dependent protein kinase